MYCWSLAWRILSITLLACEMSNCAVVWAFFGIAFLWEWKLTFSSPVATAEFSKFAGVLSAALSQHLINLPWKDGLLVLFSHPVISDSLWPRGLQHTRPPCPSPSPGVCPSSRLLHQWCHPSISSSDALFSFCPQSFPASGTFPMSHLFTLDDQNTGASTSASVLPMSIQG